MSVRSFRLGAALCMAVLLVGCGALKGLIPDQHVSNPLHLEGTSHGLVVNGSTATFSKTFGPFNNIGDLPLDPSRMTIDQAVGTAVTLTGATSNPPTITLTNIAMAVKVDDSQGDSVTLAPSTIAGPVSLTQTSGNNYTITGVTPSFPTIDTGGNTSHLLSILQGGGTNTVETTISANVSSSPALPNGSALTLTMGTETGTLKF